MKGTSILHKTITYNKEETAWYYVKKRIQVGAHIYEQRNTESLLKPTPPTSPPSSQGLPLHCTDVFQAHPEMCHGS
jgi:hypothetical protein